MHTLRNDQVSGLLLAAIAVFVGWEDRAYPLGSLQEPGPGYVPLLIAVFLGATTLWPGRFNPWGTLVAVYFLTTGINGLAQVGVSTFVQQLFYGGALVIAVLLSSLVGRPSLRQGKGRRPGEGTLPPAVARERNENGQAGRIRLVALARANRAAASLQLTMFHHALT